jgi:hypothetical protein
MDGWWVDGDGGRGINKYIVVMKWKTTNGGGEMKR